MGGGPSPTNIFFHSRGHQLALRTLLRTALIVIMTKRFFLRMMKNEESADCFVRKFFEEGKTVLIDDQNNLFSASEGLRLFEIKSPMSN